MDNYRWPVLPSPTEHKAEQRRRGAGFAALSLEERREISARGFRFTSETAKAARQRQLAMKREVKDV